MSHPTVSTIVQGPVFVARMDNPPANALGQRLVEDLGAAVQAFAESHARVLVISSALDGFFAAGADIKLMSKATPEVFAAYGTSMRSVLDRIAKLGRPSIAAIDGLALGGGLELALACTVRVGSETSRLGLPEPKLGLIPGAGGTQRLPRLIGRARAMDIMLTAREVDAAEALSIGLIDRIAKPGKAVDAAIALGEQLAALSSPALQAIIQCVSEAAELPLSEGCANEAKRVEELFASPDGKEGLAAFLAKRRPEFA